VVETPVSTVNENEFMLLFHTTCDDHGTSPAYDKFAFWNQEIIPDVLVGKIFKQLLLQVKAAVVLEAVDTQLLS